MWKPHCGRPRLRQRVESGSGTAASLDSLHAAAGLGWCGFAVLVLFCAGVLALRRFPREYVGAKCGSRTAAAPDCAKESNLEAALPPLWTLFTLRRGWGGVDSQFLYSFALAYWLCGVSRGSTLGLNVEAALRPPQTAPKSRMWKRHCRLSGLSSRCGGVGVVRIRRRHPGTRKDLTGSDLWPVRSGCIAMLPTRSNVQTRAALKRRGVGLRARSGVEAALRLAGQVGLYCDVTNSHNRRPA